MQDLTIVSKNPTFIQAEAACGTHIKDVCAAAVELANKEGMPVHFDFNGVKIEATSLDSATSLANSFRNECERRKAEWESSTEGRRAALESEERIKGHQAAMNALLQTLPMALQSEEETIAWLGKFAGHTEFGVTFDKNALVANLESAGYKRNDCVGHPDVGNSKNIFARWLVGQVLDCLEQGMGLHLAVRFADDYAEKFVATIH